MGCGDVTHQPPHCPSLPISPHPRPLALWPRVTSGMSPSLWGPSLKRIPTHMQPDAWRGDEGGGRALAECKSWLALCSPSSTHACDLCPRLAWGAGCREVTCRLARWPGPGLSSGLPAPLGRQWV